MKQIPTLNEFLNEQSLNEKASFPDNIKKWLKQNGTSKQKAAGKKLLKWNGYWGGGTVVGAKPQSLILDLTYQGGELAVDGDGKITINNKEVKNQKDFDKLRSELKESINEGNGQTLKEFADLLALLLDEVNGMAIEKSIQELDPKKSRTLEKQITTLYNSLFKLAK